MQSLACEVTPGYRIITFFCLSTVMLRFLNSGFTMVYLDDRNRPDFQWDYLYECDRVEIVGNIYENPELLK